MSGGASVEFAYLEGMDERYGAAMRELEALVEPSEPQGDVFDVQTS